MCVREAEGMPWRIMPTNSQVLAWVAVLFRLHTRFNVIHDQWWDAYLVVVAAVFDLASMVCLLSGMSLTMLLDVARILT
jgi:hypothetical protein